MRQRDINRQVAAATGESISTVKRLGFLLAHPCWPLDPEDECLGGHVIDWDEVQHSEPERRRGESPHHVL